MPNSSGALPPAPAPPPAPAVWAEVHVREHVMRYRRCGTGTPVLVLGPLAPAAGPAPAGGAARSPWQELLDALAARHRLLMPDLPASADSVSWLADFLEGLGAANVGVIAADPFCSAALDLALVAADQVARIVLVGDGGGNAAGPREAALIRAQAAQVPLLAVPRALPAGEALPLVARFLAGEGAARSS